MPPCNILYCGGGRFYLLLPRNAEPGQLAAALDGHVQDHFGGMLAVVIGSTDVHLRDFLAGNFSGVWGRAGEQCRQRKARKYSQRAHADYDNVFGVVPEAVFPVVSSAPGGEAEPEEGGEDNAPENPYRKLGERLVAARWLVKTTPGNGDLSPTDINALFRKFGWEYHLVAADGTLAGLPQATEICELNGYEPNAAMHDLKPRGQVDFTCRFIAKHWPQNRRGDVRTFEQMAKKARGAKKLGVFRADVDNLGKVFKTGLGARATAGRVSMLSQAMADFFEGYLQCLCQQDAYKDKVGILYAGGDDLFVLGAWDAVLDFAVVLRDAFACYACHNPAFSLSGGVVLIDDHVPVRHFAELAGEAEEKAKRHTRKHQGGDKQKDALTIFDMPFGFEELTRFLDLKERLLDALDEERMPAAAARLGDGDTPEKQDAAQEKRKVKPLPQGFLRKLFDVWDAYILERQACLEAGRTLEDVQRVMHWQRWRWLLIYGLRDFARRHPAHKDTVQEIQERILDTQHPVDDRLGMPLRWVELLLKKEERRRTSSAEVDHETDEVATAPTAERISS